MKYNKIQEMQKAFLKFRDELSEEIATSNKEVMIVINGKLEVTKLSIDTSVPKEQLEKLLLESMNIGIKAVSIQIQNKLTPIQNAMNR